MRVMELATWFTPNEHDDMLELLTCTTHSCDYRHPHQHGYDCDTTCQVCLGTQGLPR